MIVAGELRITTQLAREQTARQRHSRQNAYVAPLGLLKEESGRAQAQHVEDDLHGLDIGILNRLERLFDLLHADAVVLNLAGLHQIIQRLEHLGAVVHLGGRAVQLDNIERLDFKIPEAAFDKCGEVGGIVAVGVVRRKPATGFCGDVEGDVRALACAAGQ